MPEPKYMVIAGPTGVGKTDLALQLAQTLRTEIVGADAFQIYRGLDILTGKPDNWQLRAVKHHLVGSVPITETFDAYQYAVLARRVILDLNQKGTIPLVVGGTGFYLQALEQSLNELPPANPSLRSELDQRSTPDLLKELAIHDPGVLGRIDRKNRRRLIRALEVSITAGRPFSAFASGSDPDPAIPRIFVRRPRRELIERIDRRADKMFARGVVAEVAAVVEISSTASRAIGFDQIRSLLAGDLDEASCRRLISLHTRQYAKRQTTWFRRQPYHFISADSALEELTAIFRQQFPQRG